MKIKIPHGVQSKVSKELGVSNNSVNSWVNGKCRPRKIGAAVFVFSKYVNNSVVDQLKAMWLPDLFQQPQSKDGDVQ
jgi:predicted XRE-type DNA-binding protein